MGQAQAWETLLSSLLVGLGITQPGMKHAGFAWNEGPKRINGCAICSICTSTRSPSHREGKELKTPRHKAAACSLVANRLCGMVWKVTTWINQKIIHLLNVLAIHHLFILLKGKKKKMPITLNNTLMIIGSFYHVEVYSYLQCPECIIMNVMPKDKQQFPDEWEAKIITKGSSKCQCIFKTGFKK